MKEQVVVSRVITQLVSDLSGDEMAPGEGETIEFTYRGSGYSIDLTANEAKGFDKAIAMYLEHATKSGGGATRKRATSSSGSSGRSKEELQNIRAWAKENGYAVSERGRIKVEVTDAYQAAQGN